MLVSIANQISLLAKNKNSQLIKNTNQTGKEVQKTMVVDHRGGLSRCVYSFSEREY